MSPFPVHADILTGFVLGKACVNNLSTWHNQELSGKRVLMMDCVDEAGLWSLVVLIKFSINLIETYPKWVAPLHGLSPGLYKSGERETSVGTHVVTPSTPFLDCGCD